MSGNGITTCSSIDNIGNTIDIGRNATVDIKAANSSTGNVNIYNGNNTGDVNILNGTGSSGNVYICNSSGTGKVNIGRPILLGYNPSAIGGNTTAIGYKIPGTRNISNGALMGGVFETTTNLWTVIVPIGIWIIKGGIYTTSSFVGVATISISNTTTISNENRSTHYVAGIAFQITRIVNVQSSSVTYYFTIHIPAGIALVANDITLDCYRMA
jgi:hypothetical protein